MLMEPLQGKLASSEFDFGYTELFCIPGVTSVFFLSCDSVVGSFDTSRGALSSLLQKVTMPDSS